MEKKLSLDGAAIARMTVDVGVMSVILIILLALNGCSGDESETPAAVDCSGVSLSFTDDVYPIIQASCTKSGCHGARSNNGPGELLTYSEINRAKSAIQSSIASGEMPRDTRLSTNEKNTILCWIENGASNN